MRKRSSSNKRLPFMKSREDESSEGDSNSLVNEIEVSGRFIHHVILLGRKALGM
jgi:hypothetical protein